MYNKKIATVLKSISNKFAQKTSHPLNPISPKSLIFEHIIFEP